ncbi:hypothetical protein HYH03_014281 [Edaphochlamys debaryana]|uniref:PA domain-containing protein n=1 Tax=Edaphochlamys debaryana TaxID=47281 RepID=A0A835XP30_9CHLO|nr:hypothetical protein HYH03_014281 [Edaphochlamys debaryana]|eukprot:KAG2487035.1 hypothetical protein HYH03_014281 [Edaphochlamys debaryana]
MRPLRATIAVVALSLLAAAVEAGYSIESAGVKIIMPPDQKKVVKMAMADFGKPKYGGSMIGSLVYPTSATGYPSANNNLGFKCYPEDCQYGCELFNTSIPPFRIPREAGKFNIMLLDRGPRNQLGHTACYFLDKIYHAQLAGADAVLVANDETGDLSTAVAPEDDDTAKTLAAIDISAAMISLEDALLLRELLRNGPVQLQLNWTAVVPKQAVVEWEFWTNSNDECGAGCRSQMDFVRDMRDKAQAMEARGQARFTPHYLLWNCPAAFLNTTECKTECVMNGTYCVPDPDDDTSKGYSGKDVLLMNMRQLCFHRLAKAAGNGSLWWDYAVQFASNCTMASQNYTLDCAVKVFNALGGPSLGGGRAAWDACASFNETDALARAATDPKALQIPVLEEELASQRGNDSAGIAAVSILPTVRINGKQYRGSLDVGSVMRGICAGFPDGGEPPICNQAWISDDECLPGGVGYLACMSGDLAATGKTRCVNTFKGYSCECKDGMFKYTNPQTGEERCEDINECLATNVPITNPACACPRCACVNKVGSYNCTGPLENKCKAENKWGGCWTSTVNGESFSACVDTVWEFQRMAARGLVNESDPWFKCECPKCFKATAAGTCEPVCDLALCDRGTGNCVPKGSSTGGGGGGGGGGGSSKGGISGVALVFTVLASALLAGVAVLAAQRFLLRQRMGDEIRDIMAQYMPLQERERQQLMAARGAAGRGPPRSGALRPDEDSDDDAMGQAGSYGWGGPTAQPPGPSPLGPLGPGAAAAPALAAASTRAVWGPPPVNAFASSTSAPKPKPAPAAATTAAPLVDVFTLGDETPGSGAGGAGAGAGGAGGPLGLGSAMSGDADPLLGRDMAGGSSAGAGAAPPKADNPFM